jgi:hypothetical protein
MQYIKPSEEQKNIIDAIVAKKNIVVNAVAGSGKTTTLLLIADKLKHKKILQVTYNKQLKNEVRKKVENLGLSNVDIQTYHGLAVKYYDPNSHTDDNMIKILKPDFKIKYRPIYDIIVIDEVQDMTSNYYELIYKFIQDIGYKNNILILGDSYQGVYEFKNADVRFLLFSHKLWEREENHLFTQLTLNQSYRMTTQIASFVNKVMIGHDRIISKKKGDEQVYYYRTNIYQNIDVIFMKILSFIKLDNPKYNPNDIFILSPSLKSLDNPCKKLENLLVQNNIPVYYTRNEEDGIDEQIISGKIVFTTFHQAKGRERKIVFVFGFDESYFDLYAKDKNKRVCPSEIYVATTRASEILIIIENNKYNPLPFLKKPPCQIKKYSFVNYICDAETKKNKIKKKEKSSISHNTTVKNLTMYLSEVTINEISPLIDSLFIIIQEPMPEFTVDIPLTIKTENGLVEDVSDLNGIVIPAIYETKITNSISSLEKTIIQYTNDTLITNDIVRDKLFELEKCDNNNKISKYLLMGNIFIALTENIYFKLNQIDKYDWIQPFMINICFKNLEKNLLNNAKYEQVISDGCKNYFTYEHEIYGDINISGRIDAYDDKYIWELKCTSSLTIEHLLQLLIYAWMWEKTVDSSRKYRILNIRTGEVRELNYQNHIVDAIIELVFINKYDQKFKDSDEKFLKKCKKIRNKYEAFDDDVFSVFGLKKNKK